MSKRTFSKKSKNSRKTLKNRKIMRGGDNDLDTDTIFGLIVLSFFCFILMYNTTIADINNRLAYHDRQDKNNRGGEGNSQFNDILFELKNLKDNDLDAFIDKIFEKMKNDGMSYQEYYEKSKDHIKKLINVSENLDSIKQSLEMVMNYAK
jgi:hypothetical protein